MASDACLHIVSVLDEKLKGLQLDAVSYLTKPVNSDQLLSLMRVWLYKH
jgi:DNA-binding response OmpR family regulator